MEIGIFAKTFSRPTLEEALDAAKAQGFRKLQFNMSCAGLPSMPDHIALETARRIGRQVHSRGLALSAVSGTYNMAHPEPAQREIGLQRLGVIASVCATMGVSVITLCSGSRDRDNMWRRHAENRSDEAWRDMAQSMSQALVIAEQYEVTLAVEPELSNIIDSAVRARRLLTEMASPRLKIVMDAANLYDPARTESMNDLLDEAFDLLGDSIVLAHAKDIAPSETTEFVAAGEGKLDYDHYLRLLQSTGYRGDLILHGLREEQTMASLRFLQNKLLS